MGQEHEQIRDEYAEQTKIRVLAFYDKVYNRDKPISRREYALRYKYLTRYGDKNVLAEVPPNFYKCRIPYEDRPLLHEFYISFSRNISPNQRRHYKKTTNARPSRKLYALIFAEAFTSLAYATIPIMEKLLHGFDISSNAYNAIVLGSGLLWGSTSIFFNLYSSKYRPKSYYRNVDLRYNKLIGRMEGLYKDLLLEPQRLGGEVTYQEVYKDKEWKKKFEDLRIDFEKAQEAVIKKVSAKRQEMIIKPDKENRKVSRELGDKYLYQNAINELKQYFVYEKNFFKKLKLVWEKKDWKVFKPFDISKRPILAQAIRKVHRPLGERYKDLLKVFNLGENRTLKTLAGFDIATTLVYLASIAPFLKPEIAQMSGIMQAAIQYTAASSFWFTYAFVGSAWYTIANQRNFMHMPPYSYGEEKKRKLNKNTVIGEKLLELEESIQKAQTKILESGDTYVRDVMRGMRMKKIREKKRNIREAVK